MFDARRVEATLLVLALAGAAALRLWGLDVQSLWHDELFAWYASGQPTLADAVDVGALQDVHPPGFVALMYGWQRLVGDSAVALRLPSALAGVGAVAWIARLGASWLDRTTGLVASALTAVAWFPVYYSQEARAYSLLFLGAIAVADRIGAIDPDAAPGVRAARASAVLVPAVALCWLHYFGLLYVAVALAAWGVTALVRGRARLEWAAVTAVTAASYAPWIGPMLAQVDRGRIWIPDATPGAVWDVYEAMTNDALPAMLAVWALGAWCAAPPRLRPVHGLLVAWATVPVALAVGISWAVLPVMTERNLIIVAPALLLLTAAALVAIDRRVGRPVASIAVVGLLLVDLVVLRDYYREPTKWQYREVARVVEAEPGRPFFVSGAWHPSYFDYTFSHDGSAVRVDATAIGPEKVLAVVPADARVVYVAAPVPSKRKRRGGLTLAGFERTADWTFIGWDLYRFQR